MNILVIGNGFDLAHGLPTKYGDFLEFVKVIRQIVKTKQLNGACYTYNNINSYIGDFANKLLENMIEDSCSFKQIWEELLDDNIWIDYFLQCNMYEKDNWIDFESEISDVIQHLDKDMHGMNKTYKLEEEFESISNGFLNRKFYESQKTFKDLRDRLLSDLNKLIRAFEIYLCNYVKNIKVNKKSPDIESLEDIGYVLSFNYIDTYTNIYGAKRDIVYDYFHGKADIDNTIETNNMVLGIDEYLTEPAKNENIDFVAFKKFYQRIYKGCKALAVNWCADIKKESEYSIYSRKFMLEEQIGYELVSEENNNFYTWEQFEKRAFTYDKEYEKKHPRHNLYIFGHSLDVTDKDILRELILNDNVNTTIFYPDKKELGKKIANLVKVIGQDELIKRTGGSTKTIEFKLQQDMVEI